MGAAARAPWEGRAERAASRSLLSAPIGPAAGTAQEEGGSRRSGDKESGPQRRLARPAQPDPGRRGWKSDASGRAGGGRAARGPGGWRRLSSSPELAVPSPQQMTRPPPGSPRRAPFCPTLLTHSPPLLPVLAPAKISCTFLWSFLPRSPYCKGLICQWLEPKENPLLLAIAPAPRLPSFWSFITNKLH